MLRFFPSPNSLVKQRHDLFPGWCTIETYEDGATVTRGTTGLKTWEASLSLAAFVASNPDLLNKTLEPTILELGCGSGFLSLVAAHVVKRNKARLVLTDLDGEVLQRAQEAVEVNDVPNNVEMCVEPLDWVEVQHDDDRACKFLNELRADLILAADIVFDPSLIEPLCATLNRLMRGHGSNEVIPTAYVASTVRNPSTFTQFKETLGGYLQRSYGGKTSC